MSVDAELCDIERRGQRRTLGLKVRNTSPEPIAGLNVLFEWENEQHQPNPDREQDRKRRDSLGKRPVNPVLYVVVAWSLSFPGGSSNGSWQISGSEA